MGENPLRQAERHTKEKYWEHCVYIDRGVYLSRLVQTLGGFFLSLKVRSLYIDFSYLRVKIFESAPTFNESIKDLAEDWQRREAQNTTP